jgi:hypothetical protein
VKLSQKTCLRRRHDDLSEGNGRKPTRPSRVESGAAHVQTRGVLLYTEAPKGAFFAPGRAPVRAAPEGRLFGLKPFPQGEVDTSVDR